MNKIYKVIWNKTRGMYMVVSELAKSQSKGSGSVDKRRKLTQSAAALALFFSIVSAGGTAWAADTTQVKDTSDAVQTVYTKDGVDNKMSEYAKQTDLETNKNNIATNKTNIETNKNNIATLQSNTQGISYNSLNSGRTIIDNNLLVNKAMTVNAGLTVGKAVEAQGFTTKAVVATNENGVPTSVNQLTITGSTIQGGVATKNVEINSKNNVSLTAGTRQTNSATVSGGNVINQASYAILNNAGTGIQNNVSGDNGYISSSAAQIKSVASKTITEQITSTDSEGKQTVLNEVKSDENGTTFTNSGSSTTVKGNAISTGSIDATGNITAASADVNGKITAGSASVTNSIDVGHNANVGGAVNAGSLNSRGNLNVDGNALVKGTLTSQSTINGKEIVSQTNITAKNKVVGMQGVVDNTLTSGNYVTAGNTVGENINALDAEVQNNAETANQLQHSLAAEATAREAADTAINNKLAQDKTDTALHVTKDGNLIVGTKENQTVKDVKIRGQLTSGSISTGNITSTGDVSVAGKVEAGAVYDDTTKTGNYVVQTNSVGANLGALDTQVKSNADAITAEVATREAADNELNERITNEANAIHETTNQLQNDLNTETAAREAKDTELNERITNEANAIHDEIKAGDTALNDRITAVKESLQADASVQDGTVVKAGSTIGKNVQDLDTALAKETAARIGADKAQDAVIAQVNQNMVDGFNTINTNMYNGFAALNAADAAEKEARIGADKKLAEAVNNGLSLSDDNVLQKNTTTVADDGTVTTSKTDASEMILNKGNKNQITMNENGIKVGTNSSVMDADGVYTGGDTFDAAKAAMSSDGQIKGANGKFTVDANGNTTVTSLDAGTGTIQTKGDLYAKDATFSGDITAKDATLSGDLSAKDGTFSGDISAKDATFSGDVSAKDVTATGTLKGAEVTDGTATMKNGNITGVKNLSAETITTSGDATIGGDLTVKGKLNVDEIDLTKNGIVGDNNVTASTKVAAGEITGYKKATSTKDGSEKESSIDYDENGTSTWAKATDADGNWNKSTLSVEGSGVTSKVVDSEKNSNQATQTSTQSQSTITDADKNTNTATQSAAESSSVLSDKDGNNTSTFRQRINEIMQEIKSANGSTSVDQTDVDITNTAANGTITNSAKNLVNTATGDMTNTIGGKMLNDVTGDMENKVGGNLINTIKGESTTTVTGKVTEDYKSDLSTKVGGNETHAVTGNQTNTVSGNRTVNVKGTETENFNAQITNIKTDQSTHVGGNQTNIVGGDQQNTVSGSKTETVKGSVTEKYGSQSTTVDGDQSMNIGGSQTIVVAKDQTTTISGNKTESVKGAVNETYGSLTTKVNGDSSLSAKNITNTATEKLSNSAAEIENSASTSILNKVGDNVSSKMEADKITTVVKDGSKSNTVTDTASKSEQQLVSGNIIDILKDAENGYVNTTVQNSDGSSSTGVKQTTTDITNTAKQGTITNEAKNLVNKATEKLSNSAAEIENTATTSIKDIVGKSTVTTTDSGTTFENEDHAAAIKDGTITKTTISGNTVETGQVTTDYATVNRDLTVKGDSDLQGNATVGKDLTVKGDSDLQGNATVGKNLTVKGDSDLQGNVTVGKDLEVKGNTKLDGTLEVAGKSTFKDDVTMEKNLDVKGTTTTDKLVVNNGATIKGGASITGGTTTDTLHVTGASTFDGMATFKDAVSMEKDLSVGGNATVAGDVSAKSYKVADKTYIDSNGINANSQKVTNVADGDVSEGSTDAVNGGQLHATNQRVSTVENRMDGVENRVDRVENRVDNLDNRIDKVGASAAAMANLHPMDFDEDSKLSVAAAVGTYRSETAGALGVFYRPTDRVMMNVSTSFGNGENMVGGGVSFKLGKSSKRLQQAEATNAALSKQVTNLQNRLDALLGVLNPNLSKAFPDVPANHWAYEAVSRLAGNDIIQGYEDGKYHGERTMTRYEMAEIIYNALSKGAKAEAKLVEEFRPELQAMAAQRKA